MNIRQEEEEEDQRSGRRIEVSTTEPHKLIVA